MHTHTHTQVDGVSATPKHMTQQLLGSDLVGSEVHICVRKGMGGVEEVVLVRDHLSAVRAVDELDVAFEELVATVERLEGSKEATGVCVCVCVCVCVL